MAFSPSGHLKRTNAIVLGRLFTAIQKLVSATCSRIALLTTHRAASRVKGIDPDPAVVELNPLKCPVQPIGCRLPHRRDKGLRIPSLVSY